MKDDPREIARAILGRDTQPGIALPDGSLAWSVDQCLEILSAMETTTIAVLGGEFYRDELIGLVPAYTGWSCEPAPGETASDFALRSRELARHRVREGSHEAQYVVLRMSYQQDAA